MVTLKNRFPEIQAKLRSPELDTVLLAGSRPIAAEAAARAPVSTGTLRSSIEAKISEGNVGIYMAWYGRFVEHGTVKTAPRPFMVPAAEAGKDHVADTVTAWLRRL